MLLKIGLTKSQIVGNVPPSVRHALRASLSYENIGQIIQRRKWYKRTGKHNYPPHLRWDGITHLYSDKTQTFPSGLLPVVKAILDANNVKYTEIEDFNIPAPYSMTLAKDLSLWQHQRSAIEAIKQNKRGVIRVGTGGGKTIASIVATQEIAQLPMLFIVNRVSLLKQAHEDYEAFLGEKVGFIGDGVMTFGRVNIATVHTICSVLKIKHETEDDEDEKTTYTEEQLKMLHALLKSCRMVIVDECHHAASDMYIKLMDNLPNAVYRIGLSATPFLRQDGLNILVSGAFGKVLYDISASELIENGTLAQPFITFVDYTDPLSEVYQYLTPEEEQALRRAKKTLPKKSPYNKVYKECVVENELYNGIVAKLAIANAKAGRLTLVSVKQVIHGNNILDAINKIAPEMNACFLHGQNKDELGEDKVKADFAAHKIKILISTLFDEGVDIPAIDVAIDAGGGKSAIKTLQLIGRAMRKYKGKTKAHIFVFVQRYTHLYNHSIERLKIVQTEPKFVIERMDWSA